MVRQLKTIKNHLPFPLIASLFLLSIILISLPFVLSPFKQTQAVTAYASYSSGTLLGFLDNSPYACNVGIRGWACRVGSAAAVKVGFYADGPYNPNDNAGSLKRYLGETMANVSEGDDAAIDAAQFCNTTGAHRFVLKFNSSAFNKIYLDGKKHTVYGYIDVGDNQIHELGKQGQNFTCSPSGSTSSPTSTPGTTPTTTTTTLKLILGLPGIGFNAVGGAAPKHSTRSVTVELYDSAVTNPSGPGTHALATSPGTVTFDSSNDNNAGYFVGNIQLNLPATAAAGNQYQVLVQVPQYLYKLAVNAADSTSIFTITKGATVTSSPFTLLPGDVLTVSGEKNKLNLDDYTQLASCFHDVSSCGKTSDNIPVADLDDNGTVDLVDFNLFVRSIYQLQQTQTNPPACEATTCQGD